MMTIAIRRRSFLAVLCPAGSVALVNAASVKEELTRADGRKRAAENGARAIRGKAPQDLEQTKTAYTFAAHANSTWLDAIAKGDRPAAEAACSVAASTLVQWVAVRNRALGQPVMSDAQAKGVTESVRQSLAVIAKDTIAKKRPDAAATLDTRLRWKAWDELQ